MKGYIYKLTCESGNNYYGSTFNINRNSKGWYKCACKDFINPTFEIIETIDDINKKDLFLKENEYIINNECVNNNVAIQTAETKLKWKRDYNNNNREYIRGLQRKYDNAKKNIYVNCEYCDKQLKIRSLRIHQKTYCKLRPQNLPTKI